MVVSHTAHTHILPAVQLSGTSKETEVYGSASHLSAFRSQLGLLWWDVMACSPSYERGNGGSDVEIGERLWVTGWHSEGGFGGKE
jgi:hypothetical protein